MNITKDILYIGVDDRDIDLFEGQYDVPDGMCYNSYVILDEKTAVFDTVDARFGEEWLKNLEEALNGRRPDYLIVQHMEPDHSANIAAFAAKYPETVIVATKQAFTMMQQFFGTDYAERRLIVGEMSRLSLGEHELSFVTAPMVHWPEVMVTYDAKDKVLFSADGFGKFGTMDAEDDEGWSCEARRYYIGIVGKYGVQVQNLLKKAAALDIQVICPLHGPILKENLGYYINLYDIWSSYRPETEGVFIAYTSVYGHTKAAAELLKKKLEAAGCSRVVIADLARDDMAECVEDAFRHDRLVLASTSYNGDVFPFMRTFLEELAERNYQNRTIGFVENGTWTPVAAKAMKKRLENCKNLTLLEPVVTIRSALNAQSEARMDELVKALLA